MPGWQISVAGANRSANRPGWAGCTATVTLGTRQENQNLGGRSAIPFQMIWKTYEDLDHFPGERGGKKEGKRKNLGSIEA